MKNDVELKLSSKYSNLSEDAIRETQFFMDTYSNESYIFGIIDILT